ncbi:MAG: TIGR04283 family arsenosugar biosynthesis glycosyltransferase [Myxococcota bacterium]
MLGVVIPALDEAALLPALLARLCALPEIDVVVADGGSRDGTRELAAAAGARVVLAPGSRGRSLAAGAAAARGEALAFVHADTRPPEGFERRIAGALADPRVVGGAFSLRIAAPGAVYRVLEAGANLRMRALGLPYGDQLIFARRDAYARVGGFRDLPICEDLDFARSLARLGPLAWIDASVAVSARRWQREGWARATARNWLVAALFCAGVSAERLAPLYRPLTR